MAASWQGALIAVVSRLSPTQFTTAREAGRHTTRDPALDLQSATTLASSASMPSPVVFTMRPGCSLSLGSTTIQSESPDRECRTMKPSIREIHWINLITEGFRLPPPENEVRSRSPRLLQESKATPGSAPQASRVRAAGVGDPITRAQKSWEPEKPCHVLRLITGGGIGRAKSGGRSSGTAGWRIGGVVLSMAAKVTSRNASYRLIPT